MVVVLCNFTVNWRLFSDGRIYVFTTNKDRMADKVVLETFESGVTEKIAAAEALRASQVF